MSAPMASTPAMTSAGYAGAVDHYLSPDRHDAVKRLWEEPATRKLLDDALGYLMEDGPLRVLDVGCGGGDGLSLLRSASRRLFAPGKPALQGPGYQRRAPRCWAMAAPRERRHPVRSG